LNTTSYLEAKSSEYDVVFNAAKSKLLC